jgi:hypothetical protein
VARGGRFSRAEWWDCRFDDVVADPWLIVNATDRRLFVRGP